MTDGPQHGGAIRYAWRGPFGNAELNPLHAEGFGHPVLPGDDWLGQVERHSLGWVTARDDDRLVGFVNVAWDGGCHAFILDTTVDPTHRRRGIGLALVHRAVEEARRAGVEWVHVDYEPRYAPFYERCGFLPTPAGVLRLR